MVQLIQRAVFLFQPFPEGRLAQGAVADAAILVRKVPQNHAGMGGKPLCQRRVDGLYLLPVNGRGVAVVVPPAAFVPDKVPGDPADIGIFFAHPQGLCAGGRGENGIHAVLSPYAVLLAFMFPLPPHKGKNEGRKIC